VLKEIFLLLRLHQFPAGLVPVLAGLAYACWEGGDFDFPSALTVLFLTGFTLLGAACLDDYFDHRSGVDVKVENRTLLSGGSGLLQTGGWKAKTVLGLGIAALASALFLAVRLAALHANWTLTGIYAFGILSVVFYAAPPLSAAYRGWGELLIAANFGPTALELGYASQTGAFSFRLLPVALVFSGLILVIHLLHEMLDYEADRSAGKKGWVVLLGLERSKKLTSMLLIFPYVLLITLAALKFLPFAALLPLGTAAWAAGLLKRIQQAENQEMIFSTLAGSFLLHLVFGLLLAAGLVLARWV
jgi:1,4-dihydroxy-2-naphthoate octaprenyltransferase